MSPSALFVTTVPITLEVFLAPFAEHFRAQGWRVDALAAGASTHTAIAHAFDERFDISWSRNPLSPGNLTGTAPRIRALVEQGGYDIVHVHTPIAALVTRYALRSLSASSRPRVIYTAHGFHFFAGNSPAANFAYRTLERRAARWTDYLITINAEDFDAARTFGTIDPDRVRLIPGIGVDTNLFAPYSTSPSEAAALRRELDVPEDAFLVTMVAEFAPVKRHTHLLDALARTTNQRIHVVFVGEGRLESRVREHAVALRVHDRVHYAGYRRDVPALLAASDALTLVSVREGLARSVLEGMASGLPIIGTATRGIADAAGSLAGWIMAPHDVDALARAFDEAAADPQEATRRGAKGRKRAEAEFALPRIIDAYEELYREALAPRL